MLHLLKTGSILFPWFARFKRQHLRDCIQKGLSCQGLFCEQQKASCRLDRVRTGLWVRRPREIKNTHSSCSRSNTGWAERRLTTGPAEVRLSEATTTPNKRAPGTGCTRWRRVGRRVTLNRSQERSGRERRNRKWHRIFFLRIFFFFNGCNQSSAAFSDEWQASGGKLTLLKYEFRRLHFLQNTKSDQSLLIGKKGLSCVRPAGRTGRLYWRVKFNL